MQITKTHRLTIEDEQILLRELGNSVFHVTSLNAYKSILECGEIRNNRKRSFPLNTSSEKSFGRLLGYVCLLDFRSFPPEIISDTRSRYDFLTPTWFRKYGRKYISWDLTYLILKPEYYDQIIPNGAVHKHYKETGKFLHAVPKTEVWINERVPLDWIKKTLIVKMRQPMPDRNTFAGQHYFALIEAEKKWRKTSCP